jgi:hypothetical protein
MQNLGKWIKIQLVKFNDFLIDRISKFRIRELSKVEGNLAKIIRQTFKGRWHRN